MIEHSRPVVLTADDDENAHVLLSRAFVKAGVDITLTAVNDGEEVLDYLLGNGRFSDRTASPLPDLLLLDLKMPRRSGFDVLKFLNQNPRFQSLPVIVFSSSNNESDIRRARALGCRSYQVKPAEFDKLIELVRRIEREWLHRGTESPGNGPGALPGRFGVESPEMFRQLVEQVKDYAIFMVDPEGRVLTWNEGARRLKGYERAEVTGKYISIFYPDQDVENGKPEFELQMALDMGRYEDEGWQIRKDGSRFWANLLIAPLRDADGKLAGYARITRDLTHRKMQEDNLQQLLDSEHRFRLLVDQVKDYAIFILDAKGHVASWNQGARRMNGYSSDEILGKHFSIFYTPEDVARDHPSSELSIAIREGRYEEEGWRIRKDGSLYWASVVITALWDKRGNLTGFAKVTRDLTERKRESDLLRQKSEALEAFAHTLSHDLRAPLRSINSFSQILKTDDGELSPEEKSLYLDKIIKAAEAMEALISDVLKLSELSLAPEGDESIPLEPVLQDCLSLLESEIRDKQAEITIDRPLPSVRGNRTLLTQIFSNLIGNALKFVKLGERPRIHIFSTRENGECVVHVKDQGIGIAPAYHNTIFQLFQRGPRNPRFGGTGVGLAIVKKAVERIGGRITVQSEEGEGADFIVSLRAASLELVSRER